MFRRIDSFIIGQINDFTVIDAVFHRKYLVMKNTSTDEFEKFAFFGFTADQTGVKVGQFYKNGSGITKIRPLIAYVRVKKYCKMNDDNLEYLTEYRLLASKGKYSLDICKVSTVRHSDYNVVLPARLHQQQLVKGN